MSSIVSGLVFLLTVLALCYLFERVMRMALDHSYRVKILDQNHMRDMLQLRQEHERQLAENTPPAPQISIPLTGLTIRFVRYTAEPDRQEIER